MRHIMILLVICMVLSVSWANGEDKPKAASLYDNWLSRLFEKEIQSGKPDPIKDKQRARRIVKGIEAEPKGKEFAAKPRLRQAVVAGVADYHRRAMEQQTMPIGPTPAQAGAVKTCEKVGLDYPPPDDAKQ